MLTTPQEHRRAQFAAVGTPADRIVFLGDSISEQGIWEQWFPDEPVLNRGIGGETSAQVLERLDTAINTPRAVFLLIGTNDLSMAVPEDMIVGNVRSILDGIERRAPGTHVYVQSVMPRTVRLRPEIDSLNRRYRQLVADAPANVRYLDLWPALADDDGTLKRRFTLDALHLNGEGYAAWVEMLRPALADVTAARQVREQHRSSTSGSEE
jgi:lysophospholipase L1-like esterase